MNKISFDGRLVRDSEIKNLGNKTLLSFTVASDVGFGEKKQTNFFSCNRWGDKLEVLKDHLVKGVPVTVYGTLTVKEYTNNNGDRKTSLDVRVDDVIMQGSSRSEEPKTYNEIPKRRKEQHDDYARRDELEDDIPF